MTVIRASRPDHHKFAEIRERGGVGRIWNVGLEAWFPDAVTEVYDVIWIQWCLGQCTDAQAHQLLVRSQKNVTEGGWIIVKENLSGMQEDVYDETDSSVTRTDEKFREMFQEAGLKLVSTELQKGFPKALYPVRVYALQAK